MKKFLENYLGEKIHELGEQKNILIIDDENNVRESLKIILANDYTVYLAEDYAKAKQILEKTDIDVVILDVLLPKVPGEEAFRNIKITNPDTEVIIHTVVSDDKKRIKSFYDMGAYSYLIKPTGIDAIKSDVKNAYNKSVVKKVMSYLENQLGKNWNRKKSIINT